jgi:hypothetical protein
MTVSAPELDRCGEQGRSRTNARLEKIAPWLEVVKLSTRGAVLFEASDGCYEACYNHCDSYPAWLGVRLAELLKQGKARAEIVGEFGLAR